MAVDTQAVWDALQVDGAFTDAVPEALRSLYRGFIDRVATAISPGVLQARVSFSNVNAAAAEFLYYIQTEWVPALCQEKGYDPYNGYLAFLEALKEYREFATDPDTFLEWKGTTAEDFMATSMGFRPEVLARIQSAEGLTIAGLLELQPAIVLVVAY